MTNLIQSMARPVILLPYTTFKQFIFSPSNNLWILLNLVVIIILILHRINSKHTTQAPLFSFPSLSQPLISVASISLSQPLLSLCSISIPLVSLPSLSMQTFRFYAAPSKKDFAVPDADIESLPLTSNPDVVILDSVSYEDQNTYDHASMQSPGEEGCLSMEDAWNAILASGNAKPIKSKKCEKPQSVLEGLEPKAEVKNSVKGRKKKKRAEKVEERVKGWRKIDALVIPHDDISQRSEAFIKKQYGYLKLEREESDRRRLFRVTHY